MPKKNLLSVILNETKYLVRGGRLSLTKGIAASMLRLKLVIYFDHTGLVLEGKTFKTSSCIEMAKNIFKEKIGANDENVESVTIFTSGIDNMKSNIEVMKNAFSVMFKKAKIFYENLTSVFVAHTGPSYCGVSVKIK
jgi:fatty acid-binding protein DegV